MDERACAKRPAGAGVAARVAARALAAIHPDAEPDGVALRSVAYAAWPHLNAPTDQRYLRDPASGLRREDWDSGDCS